MDRMRVLIIVVLVAILGSLAGALYHLTARRSAPGDMVRALTWRVSLSVGLFALLLIAAWRGWIVPHGLGR